MQIIKNEPRQPIKNALSADNNWVFPGLLITIAACVRITVHYNQVDGRYQTEVKLFAGDVREHYSFDENNQIDLRHICGVILTRQSTRLETSGRPTHTLIEFAQVPYNWDRENHQIH